MTNAKENERSRMRWPIFQGILPAEKSQIPKDLLAGITLATLAIPEVMGYTRISGTPVITGLFTILLPVAFYAFFGSSRHLVVGADSATAAVLAAGLVDIAAVGVTSVCGVCRGARLDGCWDSHCGPFGKTRFPRRFPVT